MGEMSNMMQLIKGIRIIVSFTSRLAATGHKPSFYIRFLDRLL